LPANPWLAITLATTPGELARELRRSWESFVEGGKASVRPAIADSWLRSQAAGVDPYRRDAQGLLDAEALEERWSAHPLYVATPLLRDAFDGIVDEAQHLLVVSDLDGTLLWIEGSSRLRAVAASEFGFVEGADWGEAHAGTNAVGTALASNHALQVFAGEHFSEPVQGWTCAAAPVHDPDTGELLGVVDLTGRAKTAHPHNFASIVAVGRAIDAQLSAAMHERDQRLRTMCQEKMARSGRCALVTPSGRILCSYPDGWLQDDRPSVPKGGGEVLLAAGSMALAEPVGRDEAYVLRLEQRQRTNRPRELVRLRLLGTDRPTMEIDGRTLKLTRRHAEILALLGLGGEGMTAEELALALYGEAGQPVAARVEVSRLRKLLHGGIDAESYRLTVDVASDVAQVRSLLTRGDVVRAAESYAGPLLPRSEAPGIVLERDSLDAWVRHAVLSSSDADALWAWVRSSSGRDDVVAWKRLLTAVDHSDPRRALAAARLEALRAELAAA
jgi:hypothetical protein